MGEPRDFVSQLRLWTTPLLAVAIAIGVSVAGSELLRWRGARRLDSLRGQHWTEQTRVLAEINSAVRAFRIWLLTTTVVGWAMSNRDAPTADMVRFGAAASAVIVLLGDPLGQRWARRATSGALAPVSWREAQSLGLVMFPSRIVLLGFAALLPSRYDGYGYFWAAAFLLVLTLSHAGGAAFLLRALGFFRPARERVQRLLAHAARAAGVSNVMVYELAYARANALALPLSNWIVLTTAAVEALAPPELEAIAAHELGHLREPLSVKWFRVAGGTLLFLPLGLIPVFPAQPAYGFIAGCVALVVGSLLIRIASRRLEQRADALAHHQVGEHELYARALERIYQMNWLPAVVRGQLHPSLYDRMKNSGAEPDYARPRPPARSPLFVASALGILTGVIINIVVLIFAD